VTLPESFRPLFRNYIFDSLDPDRCAEMIICTVLSRGNWEQVEWLFDHFGTAKVREVFLRDYYGLQNLPEPTRNLWQLLFVENPPPPDPDPLARWRCRRKVPATLASLTV
jgi:hypothetical protein